jgi:signal transduction histidine kinase
LRKKKEKEEMASTDPIPFDDLGEDLERGGNQAHSPQFSKTASRIGLGFVEHYKFRDPELEAVYRHEKFLQRAYSRRVLSYFFVVVLILLGLALINGNNHISLLQFVLVPSICVSSLLVLTVSRIVTKEWHQQWVWLISGCLISVAITANEIAWKQNYNPIIVAALEDYTAADPIALFYISELGWFQTVVLIFFTVVMRLRFLYLVGVTVFSFLCFVLGCLIMSPGIAVLSLVMRISIFFFCCAFNIKISWNLEQSERTAWFLTSQLESQLEVEKQQLRKEVKKKSEAEQILVAYLCHEIRNPFNGVLGFAELTVNTLGKCLTEPLARKQLEQQEASSLPKYITQAQTWCGNIVVNSKHILDILDNVLDLSQMEEGTLQLASKPIKVSDLCEEIHQLLRPTVRKGVLFKLEVFPPDLVISGDRQRWKQLLVNLLSNAFKFTYSGTVLMRMRNHADGKLVAEVCDTGGGIGEKQQLRLFQKYNVTARKEKGTGLGLVIAQRIAMLMHSKIEVESPWVAQRGHVGDRAAYIAGGPEAAKQKEEEGVVTAVAEGDSGGGNGTRFYFTVADCAISKCKGASLEADAALVETQVLPKGLRVLVVDDDPLNRMIMRAKLQQSDEFRESAVDVYEATSEADVLAQMEEHGGGVHSTARGGISYFDVVLMDEHLGDQSARGSELTRQLRGSGCTAIIIACSGNCLADDEAVYKSAGADHCWPKPYPDAARMHADLRRFSSRRLSESE